MQEDMSKIFNVSIICSCVFLFCVIIIPMARAYPFMSATKNFNYGDNNFVVNLDFHYDNWDWELGTAGGIFFDGASSGYSESPESNVKWVWDVLEYWGFLMFIFALLGTTMIIYRPYRLVHGYTVRSWINVVGFAVGLLGVLIEWILFFILDTQQDWKNLVPDLVSLEFNPSLNSTLLVIHFVGILFFAVGAFPEIFWPLEEESTEIPASQVEKERFKEAYRKYQQGEISEEEYVEAYRERYGKDPDFMKLDT